MRGPRVRQLTFVAQEGRILTQNGSRARLKAIAQSEDLANKKRPGFPGLSGLPLADSFLGGDTAHQRQFWTLRERLCGRLRSGFVFAGDQTVHLGDGLFEARQTRVRRAAD